MTLIFHITKIYHIFADYMREVKPYKSQETKKEQIQKMFDNISSHYDFLNRFLSIGIDNRWRKKLIKNLISSSPDTVLDIATGTGDVAIKAAENIPDAKIYGLDLSSKMLEIAEKKVVARELDKRITFQQGDSENLPYADNSMDAITCAFGVRNFQNLNQGLREMYRVLKPGGACYILEFSQPKKFPFAQLYHFYFKNVLPLIGKIGSSDKGAYKYLYKSAMAFPSFDKFCDVLEEQGFSQPEYQSLTMGICCIYSTRK